MPAESMSVFIEHVGEGVENSAWMHDDESMCRSIIPRAYTSDLGILRLRVKDLRRATEILAQCGFTLRQRCGIIEVAPKGSHHFIGIVKLLAEHGLEMESTAIIPGIYQG
jgi:hypothetical protein